MTVVSIRQPGYLPSMGFFKKIQSCDIFVFLDDVQFTKNDWDNRNKIKTSEGIMWLTVPVVYKFGQKLNEIKIANNGNWKDKHRKAIKLNYQKSRFFENYWTEIDDILAKEWDTLIDLNFILIDYFSSKMGINTKTIRSSELNIKSTGSERLLEICKRVSSDTYLSGELGKNYLDEEIFKQSKIKIIYEKFQHPIYTQLGNIFQSNMSIIDLLFNEGEKSKTILENLKTY
tara:strand:- start:1129 stop:1818 length:690 start_codon:yes stop_codon:yes gene_type:complete